MINILILHELSKNVLTMYGISKNIKSNYAVILTPSIGTIKPALIKLEEKGFITSQRFISKGGRPSRCYAITEKGKSGLKNELLSPIPDNPIQFLMNARVRIYCAEVLSSDDFLYLLKIIKQKTELLMIEAKNLTETDNLGFCPKMVFENLACEYKNFYNLLEGIEHACKH